MISLQVSISIRIVLLIGLIICLLDCLYILYTMDDITVAGTGGGSVILTKDTDSNSRKLFPSTSTLSVLDTNSILLSKQLQLQLQLQSQAKQKDNATTDEKRRRHLLAFDKTQILSLLDDAGIDIEKLDLHTLSQLPSWTQVTNLYGSKPIIIGLDTCTDYQLNFGNEDDHIVGTAGTFNTGTNLLSELLIHNCYLPKHIKKHGVQSRGIRWQVPWGKHTPIDNELFRRTHKTDHDIQNLDVDNVLPIVVIRDPARWMTSMCYHPYAMEWIRDDNNQHNMKEYVQKHCPNLVPNTIDIELDSTLVNHDSIPINIIYSKFNKTYTSMIHHWNEYYNDYIIQKQNNDYTKFPRLIIRYEDIIFYPMEVIQSICTCAGGLLYDENHLTYVIQSAKSSKQGHDSLDQSTSKTKSKTGYIDSIIKYGTDINRWSDTMTVNDLQYFTTHVDSNLMSMFNYQYPNNTQKKYQKQN